jgi:putative phage-type endonuclease
VTADERTEWLAWRQSGVGASDVAGIVGLSPWSSPWSVWANKVGLIPEESASETMEFGQWAELMIGPWFAHRTGLHVAGEQTWCTHRTRKTHLCTVDGFVVEEEPAFGWAYLRQHGFAPEPLGPLQIKAFGPGRRWDEVPADIQCQEQWEMHVTGLDRVWLAVLMGRRLDVHELKRDQGDIDMLIERVDAFWNEHVLTGDPPPVDGSDATARVLHDLFPGDLRGEMIDADETMAAVVERWKAAKAAVKEHEAVEKLAANEIKAALGDATELLVNDQLVASWRRQNARRLDVTALKARMPRLARRFTTESESRVLRSHQPKEHHNGT